MDFVCAVHGNTHTQADTLPKWELTHKTFLPLELHGGGIDWEKESEKGGRKGGRVRGGGGRGGKGEGAFQFFSEATIVFVRDLPPFLLM